jgi:hypothetical protein
VLPRFDWGTVARSGKSSFDIWSLSEGAGGFKVPYNDKFFLLELRDWRGFAENSRLFLTWPPESELITCPGKFTFGQPTEFLLASSKPVRSFFWSWALVWLEVPVYDSID